jgi:hypothetical protein
MSCMTPHSFLRRPGLLLGLVAICVGGPLSRTYCEVVALPGPEGTSTPAWEEIKGDTYDQRAHFAAGADRLAARLDSEIRLLRAKRAGMTTDLKDWDFAMKDVDDSHDLLTSRITELKATTTPETWADAKDKVGEAWRRAQAAVDKMNTTVTS